MTAFRQDRERYDASDDHIAFSADAATIRWHLTEHHGLNAVDHLPNAADFNGNKGWLAAHRRLHRQHHTRRTS